MSAYDKNGKFIKSYPNPAREQEVVPDSTGEGMLKIACVTDFPKDKPDKPYFTISGNDVFAFTRQFVEWADSQKDQAPK